MRYTDDAPEAPGDWQVDHDLCVACGAPPLQAPDLMGFGNNHVTPEYVQCYFKRQPQTREEHNRAFQAASVSCCGAVRYCGSDPELVRRMRELDTSQAAGVSAELLKRSRARQARARRMLFGVFLLCTFLAVLWLLWRRL